MQRVSFLAVDNRARALRAAGGAVLLCGMVEMK